MSEPAPLIAAPLSPAALAIEAAPNAVAPKTPFAVVSLSVEMWARRKNTHPVILKAAIVGARWQVGEEFDPCLVTEAEYDHAVSFAENPHLHANPPKGK